MSSDQLQLNQTKLDQSKLVCGLHNLGNTCFLNSVIQMLHKVDIFRNHVCDDQTTCVADAPGEPLFSNLKNLFLQMNNGQVVNPMQFVRTLQIASFHHGNGQFVGFNQNDSNELWIFLLDMIHESLHKQQIKTDESSSELEKPVQNDQKSDKHLTEADKVWSSYFHKGRTFISDRLFSQIIKSTTCSNCGHVSYNYDPVLTFMLPVAENIDECWNLYNKEIILDDDNKYKCEKCQQVTNAKVSDGIYRAGEVLTLTLKRFCRSGNHFTKDDRPVDIPPAIDINNITVCNAGKNVYRLRGGVIHSGGVGGGHYFSYCRVGDKWYCFNDSSVTEMPEHNVLQGLKQAYMVVYEEQ